MDEGTKRARGVVALVAAVAGLALAAPAASADTARIDFLDAVGVSDPVAGLGRTFVLTGTTAAPTSVYVKYRAPGGAPCAPSARTDSGSVIETDYSDRFYGTSVNGAFRLPYSGVWSSPGTYLFCIWLAEYSTTSTTPISQLVTFRNPTGTISATTNPVSPLAGEPTTVTITGASEAPQSVYAKVRRAGGAPCAPSYDADSGTDLVGGESVNGGFSLQRSLTQSTAGMYLICLWLASSSGSTTPIAGPQPATYTVIAPCVVPRLNRPVSLARASAKLRAAGCATGSVVRRFSSARRGRVIAFKPRTGRRLAPGSAVKVVVSKGPRR